MPKNIKYEILTPEGFKDFTDVVYKGFKKVLKITTNIRQHPKLQRR